MLMLIDIAIEKGMVQTETEYLEKISFPRTNISKVRAGDISFSSKYIQKACKLTGANANWIFGLESSIMRKSSKKPLEQMKDVMAAIEAEWNRKGL